MARFISFESSQIFPVVVPDLAPVVQDAMQYFESQGYQVSGKQMSPQSWLVSMHKGKAFTTVFDMQTALNIEIEATSTSTVAKASIGVFGQRTTPAMITAFLAWPILLTQIWGLVQQNNLDEEALAVIEQRLITHSRLTTTAAAAATASSPTASSTNVPTAAAASVPAAGLQSRFCINCGGELQPGARFCTACGNQIVSA